jgi:hypothetical protein
MGVRARSGGSIWPGEFWTSLWMLASGTEGGDGCGWWQPPGADYFFQISFAPFAWRTGVTSSRQLAGAEYLDAMVRPGNKYPQVGSGATGVLAY